MTGREKRINEIIADELGVDLLEVTPNAHLADDLGADSLDGVELSIVLEDEFHLAETPLEEIDKITRVKDIYAYVNGKLIVAERDAETQ